MAKYPYICISYSYCIHFCNNNYFARYSIVSYIILTDKDNNIIYTCILASPISNNYFLDINDKLSYNL